MFGQDVLKQYRQRLGNVRAELVSISCDLEPPAIVSEDPAVKELQALAGKLCEAGKGICGILVRVIDSLGA
jgi:hypothetical protein